MKAWRELGKLPRPLWILCLATLVNRMGSMALPFLVLYLTKRIGFTPSQAGLTLALYGGVALLVAPAAGRLSDRWGALRLMQTSLTASGLVLLGFPLVHGAAAVVGMTALLALTSEAFRPASLAMVGELGTAEHRKAAFALNRLAINLGMSIGPAVGGFLAHRSFPALFLVDGLTALAAAAVLVGSRLPGPAPAGVEKAPAPAGVEKAPAPAGVEQAPAPAGVEQAPAPSRRRGLLAAFLADRDLRRYMLAFVPVAVVFFQHESSMPLFLVRDLGMSESVYGLLFTVNTLLILALEVPLNAATAHWPHRRSFALGSLLFGIGFGALAVVRDASGVILTVVIWTFGEMVLFPAMSAQVSDLAPAGRHGEYMGLYTMAWGFAFLIGPWAGTLVLERCGATVLWLAMLGLGLLSAAVLGRLTPRSGPGSPYPAGTGS